MSGLRRTAWTVVTVLCIVGTATPGVVTAGTAHTGPVAQSPDKPTPGESTAEPVPHRSDLRTSPPRAEINGTPPEIPPCGYYQFARLFGLRTEEPPARLFAGDVELGQRYPNATEEEIAARLRERCDLSSAPENSTVALTTVDSHFRTPPEALATWNRKVYDSAKTLPPTDRFRAVVPASAETRHDEWLRDAHATIYWLAPSTRFHRNRTTTITYVPHQFDLHAVVDFRVAVPPSNTTGAVRREYELSSTTRITCLLDGDATHLTGRGNASSESRESFVTRCANNGRLLGHAANKLHTEVSLDGLSNESFTLASYIRFQGTNVTRRCTDWNETTATCVGQWNRTSTDVAGATIVTATRGPVRRAPQPSVEARAARFPGRYEHAPEYTYDVHLEIHEPGVAAISLGDDPDGDSQVVTGQYRFFSTIASDWQGGVWINESDGESTKTSRPTYPLVPLELHAYPSRTGPHAVDTSGHLERVINRSSPPRSPPTLPDHVNLGTVTTPYHPPREIWVADLEAYNRQTVTVHGLVRGQTAVVGGENGDRVQTLPVQDVTPTNLSIRPVRKTENQVTLAIDLRADDEPVATTDRPGFVQVGDRRLDTNDSGTARVTIDRGRWVSVRYQPAPWYNLTMLRTPYQPSTARYSPDPGRLEWHRLGKRVGSFVFGIGLPVLVVLWLAYTGADANTWPPWRVFR